jgi:hypothetical protein
MPTPRLPDDKALEAADAYRRLGLEGYKLIPGINPKTFEARVSVAVARGFVDRRERRSVPFLGKELEVVSAPETEESIEELIARKKTHMQRAMAHEEWAQLIPVQVKTEGPIGLFLVGDPHIDDDYCDIAQLEHDLSTVGRTPGFFAGHVGDITNNWVGRLKALYASQSTRFSDGLRLAEWMFSLCPNLFVVNGNHDCWEKGTDLLRFIVKAGAHQSHGVRMALRWPNGKELRVHCRHDFPGKSQFSDTHGMKREILFGHRDHILVAGHTHVDEGRIEPSVEGDAHWFFRVSGYKVIDDFAKEKGFRPKRLAPGVALVLDPSQSKPAERIKPFWCVDRAAWYLNKLREGA